MPNAPVRLAVAVLAASSLFCVGLSLARVEYTDDGTYLFLIWNLFLAWIPLAVALVMASVGRRRHSRKSLPALGVVWLLFFPNAPYIVTDFVHLREGGTAPLWFDVLMISAFAWTGLLLGFVALNRVQRLVAAAKGPVVGWAVAVTALVIASFGIYIGRFEERNSWDVFVQPALLARETWHSVTSPAAYPRTLGLTSSYAAFLVLSYLGLNAVGAVVPGANSPERAQGGRESEPKSRSSARSGDQTV